MRSRTNIIAIAAVIAIAAIIFVIQNNNDPQTPPTQNSEFRTQNSPTPTPAPSTEPAAEPIISPQTTAGLGHSRNFFFEMLAPMTFKNLPPQDGLETWMAIADNGVQVELHGPEENVKSLGFQFPTEKADPQQLQKMVTMLETIGDQFNPNLRDWMTATIKELHANGQQSKTQQFGNLSVTIGLQQQGDPQFYGVYFEGP